jgi:hypothetical protein
MVAHDRIRLTGLLRKKPWQRGFFYSVRLRRMRRGAAFALQPAWTTTAEWPPVGFIAVIVGRAQLFTENTLYPVVVAVDCRDRRTFVGMTRLWAIVFATNIVGVFVFTLLAVKAGSLDPKIVDPAEDRSDRDHLDADVHARRRALLALHRVERRDPVVGAERHDPARRLLRVAGGSNPRERRRGVFIVALLNYGQVRPDGTDS